MKNHYDSKFKSRVALAAISGDHTIAEIAGEFNVHPNLVGKWKKQLLQQASSVFTTKKERKQANSKYYSESDLMCKIGRLEVENDYLRKKYGSCLLNKGNLK
jgi:transposase-like protein